MITKEKLKKHIDKFPDKFSIDELIEYLIVIEKIETGEKQSELAKIIPESKLEKEIEKWLDLVVDDVEELIIKRKNNKDLVLISLDEYNSLKETNYLLSGKNKDVLMQSIKEAKTGKTEKHNLMEE